MTLLDKHGNELAIGDVFQYDDGEDAQTLDYVAFCLEKGMKDVVIIRKVKDSFKEDREEFPISVLESKFITKLGTVDNKRIMTINFAKTLEWK